MKKWLPSLSVGNKKRSLAHAEELYRLGIAIKQACCSALAMAFFNLITYRKNDEKNG